MRSYLQVAVGPYQILLDAQGILEIIDLDGDDDTQAAGHRHWRGQSLPVVNARALLSMQDACLPRMHCGVVYSSDEACTALMMLELDRAVGLRNVGNAELKTLPPVSEQATDLFDGVLVDQQTSALLYHLRRPKNIRTVQWLLCDE